MSWDFKDCLQECSAPKFTKTRKVFEKGYLDVSSHKGQRSGWTQVATSQT